MKDYATLSEAMNGLKEEGYTEEFIIEKDRLEAQNGKYKVFSDDFEIDKFFRFEGMSDPGDSSILYAISSEKHAVKGVLVNAYGIYAEDMTNDMVQKFEDAH